MKNGNIAAGLAILVVALLAASGTLQRVWSAIMKTETPKPGGDRTTGPPTEPLPGLIVTPGAGTYSPGGGEPAPVTSPNPPQGPQNPTLIAGADPALDDVFAKWPAGRQTEWNAFLDCYFQTHSVLVCAQKGLVLSTEGVG